MDLKQELQQYLQQLQQGSVQAQKDIEASTQEFYKIQGAIGATNQILNMLKKQEEQKEQEKLVEKA